MSDDQRSIYLESAHDTEPGHACPSCEEWFPQNEYTQEWRDTLPEECKGYCESCVDDYFEADAPCVQRCADGSYQPA